MWRLFAYYAGLSVVIGLLVYFYPDSEQLVLGKGLDAIPSTPMVLPDGLNPSGGGISIGDNQSLGELALTTIIILVGTILLMLPVTWVYMSARLDTGYSQNVVQTLIILPMVVAGVVLIVQNSLALAFSLAGVVAAVRFRTTLRNTADTVFIFLAIAVGFAAGVQTLAVGAVLSIVFNIVVLLTWRYDYGRHVLNPSASGRWAAPLANLTHDNGMGAVPDRELVLALTPKDADVLANRFDRVRKVLGSKKKKPRFNAVLSLVADDVSSVQSRVEPVLEHVTKRWKLDEIITNVGKPSEMYYLIRLRKTQTRDEVLTAIREHSGDLIAQAEVEMSEPLGDGSEK
jgi:hypothetical protein